MSVSIINCLPVSWWFSLNASPRGAELLSKAPVQLQSLARAEPRWPSAVQHDCERRKRPCGITADCARLFCSCLVTSARQGPATPHPLSLFFKREIAGSRNDCVIVWHSPGRALLAAHFQSLLGSVQAHSRREEQGIHHLIRAQSFVKSIPLICITEQKD